MEPKSKQKGAPDIAPVLHSRVLDKFADSESIRAIKAMRQEFDLPHNYM